MVMDAEGGGGRTIAGVPVHGEVLGEIGQSNAISLCWMPDNSHSVFNVPESTYVSHRWLVRADGSGLTQLTTALGAYDFSVSCAR